MAIQTMSTNICDNCQNTININEKYVNAMTYGATFHGKCFDEMSTLKLVKLLNLNEIKIIVNDDWENATPITHMRHI